MNTVYIALYDLSYWATDSFISDFAPRELIKKSINTTNSDKNIYQINNEYLPININNQLDKYPVFLIFSIL